MEQMEESSQQRASPETTPCFSFSFGFSVLVKYFGLAMGDGLALVPVRSLKVQIPAYCSDSSKRTQMNVSTLG